MPGWSRTEPAVAVISYDEKPGIQAIGTTAPDLRPVPGTHPTISRDHEYKRHGTVTLMAGIDLLSGQVHALVKDRHRSREFIEFLTMLEAAYPAATAIKIILDNHSAHVSQETKAWLAARPDGRFQFVFTPKHGSWLNLVEGFFAKAARSILRHIRVSSKHELNNASPVSEVARFWIACTAMARFGSPSSRGHASMTVGCEEIRRARRRHVTVGAYYKRAVRRLAQEATMPALSRPLGRCGASVREIGGRR